MTEPLCPWCLETGWVERVAICPCKAPEKASALEAAERQRTARHDAGCDGDGYVFLRVPCDCQGAEQKRARR